MLMRFGKTRKQAVEQYERFLEEALRVGSEDAFIEFVRRSNQGSHDKVTPECWVIGDDEFQRSILQKDNQKRLTLVEYKKQGLLSGRPYDNIKGYQGTVVIN